VDGAFLGTSGGTPMAAGGPALQLVSFLAGGTPCPLTWDSLAPDPSRVCVAPIISSIIDPGPPADADARQEMLLLRPRLLRELSVQNLMDASSNSKKKKRNK